eukprot:gene2882-4526_t
MLAAVVAVLALSAVFEYDVVVYDGTSGGVMAAVAAGRRGARTVLLCASWPACHDEGGRIVGGMSSNGLGQTDIGDYPQLIGGLALEFYHRNWLHYNETGRLAADAASCRQPSPACNATFNLEPHVAQGIFEAMLRESSVDVVYNGTLLRVGMAGSTVSNVTMTTGDIYAGKVFVDAGYEADLLHAAGASYTVGRESRSQYNESLAGRTAGNPGNNMDAVVNPYAAAAGGPLLDFVAPQDTEVAGQRDSRVQAYNFRLCLQRVQTGGSPFQRPSGYQDSDWTLLARYATVCGAVGKTCQLAAPSCNTAAVPNGKFDMNNCGGVSTDFVGMSAAYPEAGWGERKKIWAAHKQYTLSLLYAMAHHPGVPESFRNTTLEWGFCRGEFNATAGFPPGLYVREARRLVGDRVFTQNTPAEQRGSDLGDLSIGLGGYNFDSHNAYRYACANVSSCSRGPEGVLPGQPYVWLEGDVEIAPGPYQIPYWVLLPKRGEVSNLLAAAAPSASHVGMSTLRMEPQFMIIGHACGAAAVLAANASVPVQQVNTSALHATLLADGQLL